MENRSYTLTRELAAFFEVLALQLSVGFDLAYAWGATLSALKSAMSQALAAELSFQQEESLVSLLNRLASQFSDSRCRLWFQILARLYQEGAPLGDAVKNLSLVLRQDQLRALEAHCRNLPTKTNIVLLLFFFPATAALLFAPLVLGILAGFDF